ncbi:MAG: GNAT family N-acetyltransferase [Gemmatimonadetes bacterium]|nr:GNAT family N-acetyltransferase [Gemmatimonadota bacterium]
MKPHCRATSANGYATPTTAEDVHKSDNSARGDGRLVVRNSTPSDGPAVLALNNASTPNVNALSGEQFVSIAALCGYFRVAVLDGELAGFVMAIGHGASYWSANYAWFGERYGEFLYVDRAIVAPHVRRSGIGRALYRDLREFARNQWPRITLEVNVQPPNPGSIVFHEAMGFRRVGSRIYDENEVALFELPVSAS